VFLIAARGGTGAVSPDLSQLMIAIKDDGKRRALLDAKTPQEFVAKLAPELS